MAGKLELEYLSLDRLIPYARNSRTHSDAQVAQIAASVREFGWTNPVLVDEAGGIIAGHGRVLAARKLDMSEVPCLRLRGLTEPQKRAYVIADNKLALNAGWDADMLRVELQELRDQDFDLGLTGFAPEELGDIFGSEAADGRDPDDAPPAPAKPHSKLGDTWVLGAHRVRCGDSTRPEDWEALMGSERADCVWTDPPYNVAYESKLAGSIQNDNMDDGNFRQFLLDFYSALIAVMKPGAAIYVTHADIEGLNFRAAFRDAGFKLSGCLIWRKNALVLGRSDYQWMHESILYGWKPGSKHRWYGGRKQVTVQELGDGSPFEKLEDGRWAIRVGDAVMYVSGDAQVSESPSSVIYHDKPKRSADHPTMKPVALIERMLKHSARSGDLVVDAFGGSGSTLIAADRLGMSARLMEYDPRFVDVICRRWAEYTGRTPVHAVSGAAFPMEEREAA